MSPGWQVLMEMEERNMVFDKEENRSGWIVVLVVQRWLFVSIGG